MSSYSKKDIKKKFDEAINKPETLYKQGFINYKGFLKDDEERYISDYVSELLLRSQLGNLTEIQSIQRQVTYKTASHFDENIINNFNDKSNREEEKIAKYFFKQFQDFSDLKMEFGKIIDFQTPLKDSNADKGVGKIDLLAYDEGTKTVRIFELKKPESEETLLRCVLESYTYSKIVYFAKLKESFSIPDECKKIIPCPLIFANKYSRAYQDYENLNDKLPNLKKLIENLGEEIFVINETTPARTFEAKKAEKLN